MKKSGNFTIEIHRWDKKKLAHQIQKIELKCVLGICNEDEHSLCKHDKMDIVLREHKINSIDFYPALKKAIIYTRKRDGEK